MTKQHSLRLIALILLVLSTACGPTLAPGVDLSGESLKGRNLRGVDLTGANLSGVDLRNAKLGMGGSPRPEKVFNGITCAGWLNNGASLGLCNKDSLKFWDVQEGAFTQTVEIPDGYRGVSLSPDGTILAVETQDFERTVSLLEMKTGNIYPVAANGRNISNVRDFAWASDGAHLLLVGRGNWIWDIENHTRHHAIEKDIEAPAWAADSKTLVYSSWGGKEFDEDILEVWNVAERKLDRTLPSQLGHPGFISWSPDDKMIAALDNLVTKEAPLGAILDSKSGARLQYLENLWSNCEGCTLETMAWSPTRPMIAGGTSDGKMVLWDVETGSVIRAFDAHRDDPIDSLQWSQDGLFILSKSSDQVKVWDVRKIFGTAILTGANLSNADLSGAELTGLDLSQTTLTGANLNAANLRGANMSGMDLQTVILTNANLSAADLSGSNLSGVDLSGVIITKTNLENTNLAGADVRGAEPIEYLLGSVCQGIGMEVMPAYTNQPGIHPLAVLKNNGEVHGWNKDVNEEWRPDKDRLPEVVLCVGDYTEVKIDTCGPYGLAGVLHVSVPLMQSRVEVTLREARSGTTIASTTILGPVSKCPGQVAAGEESIGGLHPAFSAAATWLDKYINK